MKQPAKYIIPVIMLLASIIAVFFLAPLQAWKKGTIIILVKHAKIGCDNNKISNSYNPQTCNYWGYCLAWWRYKFGKKQQPQNDNYTYDGGELPEITVTPQK